MLPSCADTMSKRMPYDTVARRQHLFVRNVLALSRCKAAFKQIRREGLKPNGRCGAELRLRPGWTRHVRLQQLQRLQLLKRRIGHHGAVRSHDGACRHVRRCGRKSSQARRRGIRARAQRGRRVLHRKRRRRNYCVSRHGALSADDRNRSRHRSAENRSHFVEMHISTK